jgi:HK97 family phage major capsid protein
MSYVSRTDLAGLIPEEEVREVFKGVEAQSAAMKLLYRLPNLSTKVSKLKVLDSLPVIYWQGADTARKQLTTQAWKNKFLTAEELAVIIPISKLALDDADYDIWGEIKPKVQEAISGKIDEAIFIGGSGVPSSFPKGLLEQAQEKGLVVAEDGTKKFYQLVSEALGLIEDLGYDASAIIGGPSLKKSFRDMTDTTGQLITGSEIGSLSREVVKNGSWDKSKASFMVGDFKQFVYAIRQELEAKLFEDGVIQDPSTGAILYNLLQDDMAAVRFTFRMGWQAPNPINALAGDETLRLPLAVVVPSAGKIKATVALSPAATTFETSQVVSMSAVPTDAKIYYTNDGTTPTAASTLYTAAITLTGTKTIKAIAVRDNYTNSDVVSVTYTKSA